MVTAVLAVAGFVLVGLAAARIVGPTSSYLMGLGVVGSVLYVTMLMHINPVITLVGLLLVAVVILIYRPPRFLAVFAARTDATIRRLQVEVTDGWKPTRSRQR